MTIKRVNVYLSLSGVYKKGFKGILHVLHVVGVLGAEGGGVALPLQHLVFQQCYNSVTTVVQQWYSVTTMLQCYNNVTVLQQCYSVTTMLQHREVVQALYENCMRIFTYNLSYIFVCHNE